MARKPKTPKFELFNLSVNCFGDHARPIGEVWDYLPAAKGLTLELGCGRAELSLEYARRNPDRNYIGIDLKSDRLYRPALTALEESLRNIAFVQMNIRLLSEVFDEHSVDEIWITFPDPQPRARGEKHRLVNQAFFESYLKVLKSGGIIHFKTDDKPLFEYALEVLETMKIVPSYACHDVHAEDQDHDFPLTDYEKKWMGEGKMIMYLRIDL